MAFVWKPAPKPSERQHVTPEPAFILMPVYRLPVRGRKTAPLFRGLRNNTGLETGLPTRDQAWGCQKYAA
jgi:hypothetical protein